MNAKTGNWFIDNPQRARSNNSALLVRGKTSKELFDTLINSTKQFGEPGFVFAESNEVVYNPCVEIGMIPRTVDYRSGWQGCNLCEINGGKMNNRDTFLDACKAAAILGTLQAAYTDFRYVSPVSKEIFDYEALLGVSITGFMNNPKTLLNEDILREGAELIKKINKLVAGYIGIRPAARTTCVKPSGNASVLLETTSGIHGDHSPSYFRVMQLNKNEETAKYLMDKYPDLLEESVWSATNADYALFIPVKSKDGSIYKKDLLGVKQLEAVRLVQQSWVEAGTNVEACIQPYLRHNVSNTISVDNWDEVSQYIWDNQNWIAGISLMAHTGDKIYNQAPFTEVLNPTEIIARYGDAALLASGLIVDGLHLFDNNLWRACDYLLDKEKRLPLDGTRTQVLLKKDWLKRAKKFASRFFDSMEDLVFCMKDVHLFHKWMKTEKMMRNIDIEDILANIEPEYTDVSTLGAVACAGANCEITSL
jgi:ribonucleoside-diphosphate reductase alpha chain